MLCFFDDVDDGIVFVFDDLFIGLCQVEFLPDVAKSEHHEAEQNEGDRDDEDRHDDRGDDLGDAVYVGISLILDRGAFLTAGFQVRVTHPGEKDVDEPAEEPADQWHDLAERGKDRIDRDKNEHDQREKHSSEQI